MTITEEDIKLLESERMRDTSDGGGRMTGNVVPDGVAGNVFPKVSRDDSVNGRVNLRKVYGAVQSANQDTYAGAHFAIMDPPDNEKVGVCAFSTDSAFDVRSAARNEVESYVIAGPLSRMTLLGDQPKDAMAILVHQGVDEPLPDVGDVLALSVEADGYQAAQQFVAIADIEHEVRTFSELIGGSVIDFDRRVLTLSLGTRLQQEFPGPPQVSRLGQNASGSAASPTLVRDTTVSASARYYGIQSLAHDAPAGALSVAAASAYHQIVPTATREVAVSLAEVSGASQVIVAGAEREHLSMDMGVEGWGINQSQWDFWLPRATPKVRIELQDEDDVVVYDGESTSAPSGVWSLSDGRVHFTQSVYTFVEAIHYRPGAAITQAAHSRDIEITLATRGTVYNETLLPIPAPGALRLSYRALGRWYTLRDEGDGELVGAQGVGTGTIDYTTGAMVVTLGALPDVGSSILLSWGSPVHYERLDDAALSEPAAPEKPLAASGTLSNSGIVSASASWTSNGAQQTGEVEFDAQTGAVTVPLDSVPDDNVVIEYTYQDTSDPSYNTYTVSAGGNAFSIGASIPSDHEVNLQVPVNRPVSSGGEVAFQPDTIGIKVLPGSSQIKESGKPSVQLGTLDRGTGTFTLDNLPSRELTLYTREYFPMEGRYMITGRETVTRATELRTGEDFQVTLLAGGSTSTLTTTETITVRDTSGGDSQVSTEAQLVDDSVTGFNSVVPGSVLFSVSGQTYIDRSGTIYTDVDPETGSGISIGSIDYASGRVTLDRLGDDPAASLEVHALLVRFGDDWPAYETQFRTAGSPLRPASTYIQVGTTDGRLLTGTADQNGVISEPEIDGAVQQDMGVVKARFGRLVHEDDLISPDTWSPNTSHQVGDYVIPTNANGHMYECTGAGTTGSGADDEPLWPKDGGAVVDNTATWTDRGAAIDETAEDWYDPSYVDGQGMIWRPTEVLPETLRYSTVVQTSLPLDASLLGIDPVRLPQDGRVPVFRAGDMAILHDTQRTELASPASPGHVTTLPRDDLAVCYLEDQNGDRIPDDQYTVDLEAGTVEMAANLDLSGYTEPLVAVHRVEDMVLLSDVQIDGTISLAAATIHDYIAGNSYISTALRFGDLSARLTNVFDMQTWTNTWADDATSSGSQGTLAEFNDIDYPIEVLNESAVTERWAIRFTSTSAFELISENMGVIATGDTATDFSPMNPRTGKPYFVLRSAGWGGGWSAGYVLRFDTIGANAPIWMARTILAGASRSGDSFAAEFRGDTD